MNEFKELAQLVVNAIVRDGAAESFINSDPVQRESIVMAYVESEVKRFDTFSNMYHTMPDFKADFLKLFRD